MAAPFKDGLDYFTCDCIFEDKVELVIAEFGMKGLGILIKLWQKIYNSNGYYCLWDDDVALMFANKISTAENIVSVNVVSEFINACLRRGVFDRGMFEHCNILTSAGIQKRYFEATKRRNQQNVKIEYLLINAPKNAVNVSNNSINVNNNSKNVDDNSQSKVKESKVNKSKVDNGEVAKKTSKSKSNVFNDIPAEILPTFNEFIKMRKAIKKPLTDYAIKRKVAKLEKLAPHDYQMQIEILNQSIDHNWQDVYELKEDSNNGINNRNVSKNENPPNYTGPYI